LPALDSLFKCASLWLSSTFFHTKSLFLTSAHVFSNALPK
jgi:hypothetical protein